MFRQTPVADFSRFRLQDDSEPFYTSLIALDDRSDPYMTWEILDLLASHVHEVKAREALQHYRAYEEARTVLHLYHRDNP